MKRLIALALLCLLSSALIKAQVTVRDLQGWAGVKANKKIGTNWSASLEQQVRFDHNSSQLDDVLTELNAGYSLNKVQFGAGLRGIRHKTNSGDFESRMRWHLESEYGLEHARWEYDFRIRFQSRLDVDEQQALNALRIKSGVRWNPKGFPIDPYSSIEAFFLLPGRPSYGYPGIRWTTGGVWKINSSHHVRLFYHLEWNQEEFYPLWINRIGMRYDLRL